MRAIKRSLPWFVLIPVVLAVMLSCNLAQNLSQPQASADAATPVQQAAPTKQNTKPGLTSTLEQKKLTFSPAEQSAPVRIHQLWVDSKGSLWQAGENGVWNWPQVSSAVKDGAVKRILGSDRRGRVWVLGDEGKTIAYYDLKRWREFNAKKGWPELASSYASGSMASDLQDQVWFALGTDDLRRFEAKTDTWKVYTPEQIGFKLPDDFEDAEIFIPAVSVSKNGKVWVSACINQGEVITGLGVRRLNGEWVDTPPTKKQCVLDMAQDASGMMWLGGNDQVLSYDPSSGDWKSYPLPEGRPALVLSLVLGPDQMPWIEVARAGGASLYGTAQRYHLSGGQWVLDYDPGSFIQSSLAFDASGHAWLCANGKVFQSGSKSEIGDLQTSYCQIVFDGTGRGWVLAADGENQGLWWFQP